MKQKVKWMLWLCFLLAESLSSISQEIELRGGLSLLPGVYAAPRYEHYTNSSVNIAGGVFLENSKRNNLSYSSFGVDLLAQYKPDGEDNPLFTYKAAIGGTLELDQEPWVYKDWPLPKRFNYGIVTELAGVIHLTEAFGLSAFVQQKFLFNKILGTTHFFFGVSLSYRISQ